MEEVRDAKTDDDSRQNRFGSDKMSVKRCEDKIKKDSDDTRRQRMKPSGQKFSRLRKFTGVIFSSVIIAGTVLFSGCRLSEKSDMIPEIDLYERLFGFPGSGITSGDTTPPVSVTGFSALQGGADQIDLSWTASTDDTTQQTDIVYEICISTASGGCSGTFTTNYISSPGAVSYSVTGLNPTTTYYFMVRAVDSAGNRSDSGVVISASTSAVGQVSNPTFSPAAGTYNGTQGVSMGSSTTGSSVCYTTNGSDPACDPVTQTCTAGTQFVSAVSISSNTTIRALACKTGYTNSNIASASYVIDTANPAPVTGFTPATAGSSQIDLSWNASSDDTTPVANLVYEICMSTASGGCNAFAVNYTTAAGVLSYSVGSLTPLTTYYFSIRAKDQFGKTGTPTAQVSAATTAAGTVNNPTFDVTPGRYGTDQTVQISSTTPTPYLICYTADGNSPACNSTPSCTAGSIYSGPVSISTPAGSEVTTTLKAVACKAFYTGSSISSAVYTIDKLAPGTVTGTSITPSHITASLNWTNPGDADFTGVKVVRNLSAFPASYTDGTTICQGNITSCVDTIIDNCSTRYYSIYSYDALGNYSSGVQLQTTPLCWKYESYIKASNSAAFDNLGYSVSIDGDTLVAGAIGEDSNQTTITNGNTSSTDNSASNSGAAYVYIRDASGNWSQQAYIKASNADASDGFGTAVGISGNTIAVGATGESSNQTTITNGTTSSADNSAGFSGAVYVYVRSGSSWSQQAYIKASNAALLDNFGGSIGISGDTIAVAATGEDSNQTTITNGTAASADNSAAGSGAVYVYVRSGTSWSQQAYIKASNADTLDQFGISVGISVDTIAVGAEAESSNQTTITNGTAASADNSAAGSGAVYVYVRSGTSWSQQAYIKPSNSEAGDFFGGAVGISGDTIVVGARGEDSNQITISNGAAASADNSAAGSGAVYVYVRSGTSWSQQAYLKASNAETGDFLGRSVGISGDTISAGANNEDSIQNYVTNGNIASADNSLTNSGAIFIFSRSGTTWSQQAYIKASNADSADLFGEKIHISGNTVVAGVSSERSSQTTITNGGTAASADNSAVNAGAVYVYTLK